MAKDTVKETGCYEKGSVSFNWKIFENGDGLRLEIKGEGKATAEFVCNFLQPVGP